MVDNNLEEVYHLMIKMTAELVASGKDSIEIAAVMTRVALQIYKTTLSDEDYNKMVDFISNTRNEINRFDLDVPLH